MEKLPKEALYQILFNLPLKDLERDCKLNKKINSICQSKVFWVEYGNKKYWLKLDDNLNIEEMKNKINKADYILEEIRRRKLLITYDAYLFILDNIFNKDKIELLLIEGSWINKIVNIATPINSNFLGLNVRNIGRLENVIEIVSNSLPTLYTDGYKLFVLNFNPDINLENLYFHFSNDENNILTIYQAYKSKMEETYQQYLYMQK